MRGRKLCSTCSETLGRLQTLFVRLFQTFESVVHMPIPHVSNPEAIPIIDMLRMEGKSPVTGALISSWNDVDIAQTNVSIQLLH